MLLVRHIMAAVGNPTKFDEIATATHDQHVSYFTRCLGQDMVQPGQQIRVSGPHDYTLHEQEFKEGMIWAQV